MKKQLTVLLCLGALFLVADVGGSPHGIKAKAPTENVIVINETPVFPVIDYTLLSDATLPAIYVLREQPLGFTTLETPKTVRQYDLVTNPSHAKHLRRFVRLC